MLTVLHISPHADDEMIGCPATLLSLRDTGDRVVNLLLNLSSPRQRERRTREASEAHRRSGIELRTLDPTFQPSGVRGDSAALEKHVTEAISSELADLQPDIVIGPQPHDIHEAHELAGRSARRALEEHGSCHRWWMWGIWSELLLPNLFVPFDEERLAEITHILGAYEEEIGRNDYRQLVRGRGLAYAVIGSERVFGFGAERASPDPYAEVLTEVRLDGANWTLSAAATMSDGLAPDVPPIAIANDWLGESTVGKRLAHQRMSRSRELFA
jgi:LmbE family N-acetylglucosaminyl deacetylase